MRIKPTQDYILVKRKEQKTKTTSGLIIPEQKVAKYDVLDFQSPSKRRFQCNRIYLK